MGNIITFTREDAAHLYELALEHFVDDCVQCKIIKERLEGFLGEEVKSIKKAVEENPYCEK